MKMQKYLAKNGMMGKHFVGSLYDEKREMTKVTKVNDESDESKRSLKEVPKIDPHRSIICFLDT